jgi:hypothetical protein
MALDKPLDPAEKVLRKYAGEWVGGRMQGSGKLVSQEEIYQGCFLEGQYSGEGVLTRGGKVAIGKFH